MAITYGFYNSLNKDRVYNAEQMSSIFNGIITDGVFSTIGDALMPVAGTGMQVVVKTGKCWFNSTWTLNDALLPLDIPAADVSLTRIDAVIVEINSAVSTRANTIKVIKGTPSANPAKPTLTNTETLHQYALGYVTVGAGVTSITADKIEVNVGKTTCPFITSVLQQTNITDLFNQWDAEFNAWFTNIQSQLAGDIAANLQNQINQLENNKADKSVINSIVQGIAKTTNLEFLAEYASVGSFIANIPSDADMVYAVIVGAGGGGGGGSVGSYNGNGGSGGNGGHIQFVGPIKASSITNKSIVIGAGGAGGIGGVMQQKGSYFNPTTPTEGSAGSSTSVFGIVSYGGEGGAINQAENSVIIGGGASGGFGGIGGIGGRGNNYEVGHAGSAGVISDPISIHFLAAGGGGGSGSGGTSTSGAGGTASKGSGGRGGYGSASNTNSNGGDGVAGTYGSGGGGGGGGSASNDRNGIGYKGGNGGAGGAGYAALYIIRKGA